MNRDEVIGIMNNVVNQLNRQFGESQNLTYSQIEEALQQHQDQLTQINGIIYDELKQHGVIV